MADEIGMRVSSSNKNALPEDFPTGRVTQFRNRVSTRQKRYSIWTGETRFLHSRSFFS
jgi:hypothetical protein